jgi:uncharacterized protein YdcH (DUF465 family)
MTTTDKELIEKVCAEDEEFKALYEDHRAFEEKIEDMLKRPPTSELHFEVDTLKKQKLAGKDKMERILTRYR